MKPSGPTSLPRAKLLRRMLQSELFLVLWFVLTLFLQIEDGEDDVIVDVFLFGFGVY